MKRLFAAVLAILIFSGGLAFGQNVEKSRYKFAQSFENSGDYETAARIYLELLKKNPSKKEYFDGLVRSYKALNKYSELKPYVKRRAIAYRTPQNLALLGEIYWRLGQSDSANAAWKEAVELSGKNKKAYLDIAKKQIEVRLFEKAISVLKTAREKLASEDLFADELSQLYIATGDYENGIKETFKLFYKTKNFALAQGRLAAILTSEKAKKYAEEIFEEEISDDNLAALSLYAWFQRQIGDYDKAFEIYKKLDQKTGQNGRNVLSFADQSRRDGQYDVALKAYEYILKNHKDNRYYGAALFGYPRALEQKLLIDKKLTEEQARKIVSLYRKIVEKYPGNPQSRKALLRIAFLRLTVLNDRANAKQDYLKLVSKYSDYSEAAAALNKLGDISLAEDDIEKARDYYKRASSRLYKAINREEADRARFNLAELTFFEGKIEKARELYSEISNEANSDIANDALERLMLVDENKDYVKALKVFAKAEFQKKKKNYQKAFALYDSVARIAEGTNLAEISILTAARIHFEIGAFDSALNLTKLLLEKYPKSVYKDKALSLSGDCLAAMGHKEKAIERYSKILTEFPNSIYAEKARKRIRELRGEKNF